MKREQGQAVLACVRGNIVAQPDMAAIVNAANAALAPGGGVAGAIHRAAGPGLYEECRHLAPIAVGTAVITGAHGLPNRFVIHCLGPRYGIDHPEAALLAACHREALARAEEKGAESVAFPAISTGIFGYPVGEAAPVALTAVWKTLPSLKIVRTVRFVLWNEADQRIFAAALAALREDGR